VRLCLQTAAGRVRSVSRKVSDSGGPLPISPGDSAPRPVRPAFRTLRSEPPLGPAGLEGDLKAARLPSSPLQQPPRTRLRKGRRNKPAWSRIS